MKKASYYTDWVDSTLFNSFISPIESYITNEKWVFIDKRIEDLLNEMIVIYDKYNNHCNDYTSIPGTHVMYEAKVLGKVGINRCSVCLNPKLSRNEYLNIIKDFLKKYNEFREYVGKMKLFADTI